MKSKLGTNTSGQRIFAVVLGSGEDAVAALASFASWQGITGASLTAIGAFERATFGWFDFQSRYCR